MKLGAFSVSLAVKDIHASKAFYEKLGFTQIAGDIDNNYLILRNATTTIGLFQGMFEKNILTFNPGWDADCSTLESFTDVRELQTILQSRNIDIDKETDPDTKKGPASLVIIDPDGNPILLDQHV